MDRFDMLRAAASEARIAPYLAACGGIGLRRCGCTHGISRYRQLFKRRSDVLR
jgi:hypothetical protein